MLRKFLVWNFLLSCAVAWAVTEEPSLPPIDATKIAARVVGSLKPQAGERAVLVYDAKYYPELAEAIQTELYRAGVYPIVAFTFDPPAIAQDLPPTPQGQKKREDEAVSLLRPLFEKADIFLWLPGRGVSPDLRLERLLDLSRARGIHFHWVFPLAGRSNEEIALLTGLYQRAVLETDYAALSRRQDRLIAALRGQTLRITSPDGTDLRLRVAAAAAFHKNDGDISPERVRRERYGVRGREMEFPAGALRFIPVVASVEGKLVVDSLGPAKNVTFEFERGQIVRVRAAQNESVVRDWLKEAGGDADKVGEIVIGTNPLLVTSPPDCLLSYFGYAAGCLRISLGDNWESGGSLRSPSGRPASWLFLDRATLIAGEAVLLRDGRLVP